MKQTFIMFLGVLTVLASCQKNDSSLLRQTDGRIEFGLESVGMKTQTKAYSENTATQVQANGFNVAAITGTTTLFNEKAVYSSTSSKYSPENGPYYYPSTGTVDFFAVYPVSQSVTVTSGVATLSYTQNGDTDLLAAKKTGVSSSDDAVSVTFDHILSLLKFTAEGTDSKALYKVKSIKVTVPSSGTYAYSNGSWTPGSTSQYTYSSSVTQLSGTTVIDGALTVVPSTPTIAVEWDTYTLDGSTLVHSYTDSKALDKAVTIGNISTIKLQLPNDEAKGITFTVNVNEWGTEDHVLSFAD